MFKHMYQIVKIITVLIVSGVFFIQPAAALPTPNLVASFDNTNDWSVSGGGAFTEMCPVVEGDGSVLVTGNGEYASNPRARITLDNPISTDDLGVIAFAVEKRLPRVTTNLLLRFGQGNSYSDVDYNVNVANLSANSPNAIYWIAYDSSEISSFDSGGTIDSVVVSSPVKKTPYSVNNAIDALYTNAKGQPTIVIGFDDAEDTIATIAYPYMEQYGLVGTVYLPTQLVGTDSSLTWDQVTTLSDAGWAISVDGSPDDTSMIKADDLDTAVSNATSQWDDLREHDLDSSAMYHLCYPNGTYFDSTVEPVHVTKMTSDGTNVVTFDKAYSIQNGMNVYGANIPENTYVINNGGDSVYSVKLSAPIPTQALPAMFNDETGDFYLGTLSDALDSAGFKSGRITGGGDMYTRFGFGNREMMTPGQGVSYMTFAQVKPMIEKDILRGTTIEFYFHRIVSDPDSGWTESTPNPGINVYESFFKAFIDEIYEKQNSGELDILTKPEWYERDIDATVPTE